MIELVKNRKLENKLDEVYAKCKAQENLPKEQLQNYLIELYALFSDDEISDQIAKIITPPEINAEVEVIFQTIENLHSACPDHLGDWYFSGNYPTPGGNKVVNKAFMNYMEGNENRSY
jgi:amidophosphoribosyltransferase